LSGRAALQHRWDAGEDDHAALEGVEIVGLATGLDVVQLVVVYPPRRVNVLLM
jgi:hypothetical protein